MSSYSIQLSFRERGLDFVRLCNEKITWAARDLAEFTKNGINAGFIVSLAHKCEDLAKSLEEDPEAKRILLAEADMAEEVWLSVNEICAKGRQIFRHQPAKYHDYVISLTDEEQSPLSQVG